MYWESGIYENLGVGPRTAVKEYVGEAVYGYHLGLRARYGGTAEVFGKTPVGAVEVRMGTESSVAGWGETENQRFGSAG